MSILNLKLLFNKKVVRMYFLVICSLLISEKAFAVWNNESCGVLRNTSNVTPKSDHITIFFKFFEYEKTEGIQNSFLKGFVVEYSKDKRQTYNKLMSASTKNQTHKTWAWIDFKDKIPKEKIELVTYSRHQPDRQTTLCWKDDTKPRLEVAGDLGKTNEVWCVIHWYPNKYMLDNVTHIKIKAVWYSSEKRRNDYVLLNYDITPVKVKLSSKSLNLSNSSTKQEIRAEEKSNTVKAYKNANLIVVKCSHNETIRVYTATGTLLKSVVADCDVLQIPVPANQFYYVNVGQGRYKVVS